MGTKDDPEYYATPVEATRALLKFITPSQTVKEPCCGGGHIARVLKDAGHFVVATDLYDFGYGHTGIDFLANNRCYDCDLITNPPYKRATEFIAHALDTTADGRRVIMFLPLVYLAGKDRYLKLWSRGLLTHMIVFVKRMACAKGGDFKSYAHSRSSIDYAWFIFEKRVNKGPFEILRRPIFTWYYNEQYEEGES